ncbi:hypothetical protein JRO89_XS05G0246100 [Xanthoceras sorbifolium]|uniref:Fe2OG dioxygenase domain-containing protein n=1 Tax=Xanthoceras sorbifolium TaxID=99658 RepID=A0ABQ8I3F5_9ROSI|nr:hypothetical protein JRO89_XS05G0246100 [Xanthoceras sorbifolium]
MALEASMGRRHHQTPPQPSSSAGNGVFFLMPPNGLPDTSTARHRLRLNPSAEHNPDSYDDLQLEFSPLLFSSLERYLPPAMLSMSRDAKLQYMRDILLRYSPDGERTRVRILFISILLYIQRHKEYRQRIISNYQPLHRELYTMHATNFFVPSFLKAINENTVESFRSIMTEPIPGIYTFEMLQPHFCEMLLTEVDNFERWIHETKFRIMRPNTMNKFGAVLDDFGLETMLSKLMNDFIRPISRVFFPDVGGSTLDSHHGFVVEYGMDRDVELGFHVDDSEVTLNVCVGSDFSGGELFFRGVRCDNHVNSETKSDVDELINLESAVYPVVLHDVKLYRLDNYLGASKESRLLHCHFSAYYQILHRGRHRHGARATTSGCRVNLLLWCRRPSLALFRLNTMSRLRRCEGGRGGERQVDGKSTCRLSFMFSMTGLELGMWIYSELVCSYCGL